MSIIYRKNFYFVSPKHSTRYFFLALRLYSGMSENFVPQFSSTTIKHLRSSSFDWFCSMSRVFFVTVNFICVFGIFFFVLEWKFNVHQISHIFSYPVHLSASMHCFFYDLLPQSNWIFSFNTVFPCMPPPHSLSHTHALWFLYHFYYYFAHFYGLYRVFGSRKSITAAIDMFQ